ncbi:MAG: PhzF family phenazine biosynthesis protein [Spirosomataceae bacterium]
MKLKLYQVDAFTDTLFKGNPAAVCLLDEWLPKPTMQAIAAENNLAETAFLVRIGNDFDLKWFTPTVEIDLCGHATVASAKIIYDYLGYDEAVIRFHSNSGILTVSREDSWLYLNFPSYPPVSVEAPPAGLLEGLGITNAQSVWRGRTNDYMVVLDNQEAVSQVNPDFRLLKSVAARGIIVTARGNEVDFVSRFFGPASGIDEDPVTGSAHCILTPYWAGVLGKTELIAKQISPRGGDLRLKLLGDRVEIGGQSVVYLAGEIEV